MIYETTIAMPRKLKDIVVAEQGTFWPDLEARRPGLPRLDPAEPVASIPNPETIELLERLQANLEDLTQELWGQQRQRLAEMQRVAVELAIAVASRLLHQRIDKGDLAVENLVRQVAERLEPQEALTIYLHPADLALWNQQTNGRQCLPGEGKLTLVADESLGRGDCRAETGDMSLLLNLDKQLEEVRKHLLDVLPDADVEQRKAVAGERQLRRFPERRHIA